MNLTVPACVPSGSQIEVAADYRFDLIPSKETASTRSADLAGIAQQLLC
jgi:hypothetical protein